MHTNYQIDGNTNTQKDRAGLRLLPVSEIVVKEVKVSHQRLRPRVRPDHGHGLQRDHPVGHQRLRAATASFRFRRKDFSETPFYFTGTKKPDTHVDNYNLHPRRPDPEGPDATSTWAMSTWIATCPRTA